MACLDTARRHLLHHRVANADSPNDHNQIGRNLSLGLPISQKKVKQFSLREVV